jgi:hypothetical protein
VTQDVKGKGGKRGAAGLVRLPSLSGASEAGGTVGVFRCAGTVRRVGGPGGGVEAVGFSPTRLETRTKESTFSASPRVLKPEGRSESRSERLSRPVADVCPLRRSRAGGTRKMVIYA